MITKSIPSEAIRVGYEASVYFDPESINYSFEEWEDDETGSPWSNFCHSEIYPILNPIEQEAGDRINSDSYDAGAIYFGDRATCEKIYEELEKIVEKYPFFDIGLEIVDFAVEFPASECLTEEAIAPEFQLEGSSIEETKISLVYDQNFGHIFWVSPGNWLTEESVSKICSHLDEIHAKYEFSPQRNWIGGEEGCMGVPVKISRK